MTAQTLLTWRQRLIKDSSSVWHWSEMKGFFFFPERHHGHVICITSEGKSQSPTLQPGLLLLFSCSASRVHKKPLMSHAMMRQAVEVTGWHLQKSHFIRKKHSELWRIQQIFLWMSIKVYADMNMVVSHLLPFFSQGQWPEAERGVKLVSQGVL